jgi:hypothetical protein
MERHEMPVLYRHVVPVPPTLDSQSSVYRPSWHKIARAHMGAAGSARRRSPLNTPASAPSKPPVKPIATRLMAWSVRMEGYGGPAQPSPTTAQCLDGGLRWLEVECNRCKDRASLPLDAIRRPRNTPIWKLDAALKCRSCRKGRYAPPVHMIKLTVTREITPYQWVHPDEER